MNIPIQVLSNSQAADTALKRGSAFIKSASTSLVVSNLAVNIIM